MTSAGTSGSTWSLKGELALVTGGTRGIGRSIAEELARHGAHVWVCARNEKVLDACLAEWASATWSGSIEGCVCDVSNPDSCRDLMEKISQRFSGLLSILVNNVGMLDPKPALEISKEDLSKIMDTNLSAGFHLSQLAYPLFKANGKGCIVFISSIAAVSTMGLQNTTYEVSKAALNQLARSLAYEWAKDNIRVNAVLPGFTMTSIIDDEVLPPALKKSITARIPLGRFATTLEIACFVAFLCMPCSSYMTGSVLTIDGGMTCHSSPNFM